MKLRKKTKHLGKPSAILTADWHIRSDQPVCRKDNFSKAQWGKVKDIYKLSKKFGGIPVLIAGDIGYRPSWSTMLEARFYTCWAGNGMVDIVCVPGQHDLPNHRADKFLKSSLNLMKLVRCISFCSPSSFNVSREFGEIWGFPYGEKLKSPQGGKKDGRNIAVWHHMVIKDDPLWPEQKAQTGIEILKKFPEYDLILTGDNHMPFVFEYKGRLLVNPGSLTRMTAAQKHHKPRVYLWYSESNTVEPYFFPVRQSDVSDEHISEVKEVDERLKAFVSSLKANQEVGLSFDDNLKRFMEDNKVTRKVREKIYEAVE